MYLVTYTHVHSCVIYISGQHACVQYITYCIKKYSFFIVLFTCKTYNYYTN